MGELSSKWSAAKRNLSDTQKAQLPKRDFGKKADEFEVSVAKALKALSDAHVAVWTAYADGSKRKAESVLDMLDELAAVCAKDKAISSAIGDVLPTMHTFTVGKLNGLLRQYEDNLKKSIDALERSLR